MDKEQLEALLIDYIDGKLSTDERIVVERELGNSNTNQRYKQLKEVMGAMRSSAGIEPTKNLKTGFERLLQEEINLTKGRTVTMSPWPYRVAAAIAFIVVAGERGSGLVTRKGRPWRWKLCVRKCKRRKS